MIKVKIDNEVLYFFSEIELENYCRLKNIEKPKINNKKDNKKQKTFYRFNER